jgi:hypothetical protein
MAYTVSTSQTVIDSAGAKPKRGASAQQAPGQQQRRAAARPAAARAARLRAQGARRQRRHRVGQGGRRASSRLTGEALARIMGTV